MATMGVKGLTGQLFDIRPRSASRDLLTYGVAPLANEFCPSRGVDRQSRMELYLFPRPLSPKKMLHNNVTSVR